MNKCINCGKPISQKEGARERRFCDNLNRCKQAYHNKNKKEKRYVQFKSFQELKNELEKANEEINELKFAKSVSEKKGHKYPLEPKDMISESGINYQKATKEAYDGSKANLVGQDEYGQTKKAEPLKINDAATQARIKQLEYELAHAPKTFSISGIKHHYFNSRETELKKLKQQLNIN